MRRVSSRSGRQSRFLTCKFRPSFAYGLDPAHPLPSCRLAFSEAGRWLWAVRRRSADTASGPGTPARPRGRPLKAAAGPSWARQGPSLQLPHLYSRGSSIFSYLGCRGFSLPPSLRYWVESLPSLCPDLSLLGYFTPVFFFNYFFSQV